MISFQVFRFFTSNCRRSSRSFSSFYNHKQLPSSTKFLIQNGKQTTSILFSRSYTNSFLADIEAKAQALKDRKDEFTQEEIEELKEIKTDLLGKIKDTKIRASYMQLDFAIRDLDSLTHPNFDEILATPRWDVFRQVLPYHGHVVDEFKSRWDDVIQKINNKEPYPLPAQFPSTPHYDLLFQKLADIDDQTDKVLRSYLDMSKRVSSRLISHLQQVAYVLNNYYDMRFDEELAKFPEVQSQIEEEIINHNWDPRESTIFVKKDRVEVQRDLLSDILGPDHPLVKEHTGDMNATLQKLTKTT